VVCRKGNLIISWAALATIIIEWWCEKKMESILGSSSLIEGRITFKKLGNTTGSSSNTNETVTQAVKT